MPQIDSVSNMPNQHDRTTIARRLFGRLGETSICLHPRKNIGEQINWHYHRPLVSSLSIALNGEIGSIFLDLCQDENKCTQRN